jgi:xanthine dehydrogenase YagT iron-sulfur-binding subunit
MDEERIRIGSRAPEFALRSAKGNVLSLAELEGRPTVLAFAQSWALDSAHEGEIESIRAELRGLGAVLLVVSPSSIFWFRPDDDVELFGLSGDVLLDDVREAARRYGVVKEHDGWAPSLFVLDATGIVRFAHRIDGDGGDLAAMLAGALGFAGKAIHSAPEKATVPAWRLTRRDLMVSSVAFGFAAALLEACGGQRRPAVGGGLPSGPESVEGEIPITLNVNGHDLPLRIDPRTTLLDALRERLFLTGTKKGCDMGQCGACTVLVDGRRINSCFALAIALQGAKITTIEGLSDGTTLHPVQAAFLAEDGFQCGYCTSGQIMSAVALLAEGRAKSDAEVREHMSGNICRCGAYPNIIAAIQRARHGG